MTAQRLHPSPMLLRSRTDEVVDLQAFPEVDGAWDTEALPVVRVAKRVKRDRSASVWYVGPAHTPRRAVA